MNIWIYTVIISVSVYCAELNRTDENYKDMYVIRATTYQIGILSNETVGNNMTSEQEAVTFYRKNGTDVDFNKIATPILTNVTGQRVVGLAPMILNDSDSKPWIYLNHAIYGQGNISQETVKSNAIRAKREYQINTEDDDIDDYYNDMKGETNNSGNEEYRHYLFKRSLFEDENKNKTTVKIIEGSAIIPPDAAIKSIGIPPLLSFNNNMSSIPVPIPNTSIVQYTKINTVVKPNNVR